jgi:hypothetical protein
MELVKAFFDSHLQTLSWNVRMAAGFPLLAARDRKGKSARSGFRDPSFARSNRHLYRAFCPAVFDEVTIGLH